MEKSKYSDQLKAEKPRRLPRNGIEPSHFDMISSRGMVNDNRKSLNLVPSVVLSSTNVLNEGFEDAEDIIKSQKEQKKLAYKLYCKKKKEEAREEKRRVKEELMRRKIVGPKGESISMINQDVFHKISPSKSSSTFSNTKELSLDSLSFPDLSQGLKRSVKKSAATDRTSIAVEFTDVVSEKNDDKAGDQTTNPKKPRKKKDPVVVDILEAIEVCKAEKKTSEKFDDSSKKIKENNSKIAGNILDSSNPLRHRGKKREVPKKRCMSRLKKAIMQERERRRHLKDINKNKMSVSLDSDGQKIGNDVSSLNTNPYATQEKIVDSLKSTIEVAVEQPLVQSNNVILENLIKDDIVQNTLDIDSMVKEKLHSRKFREYCNHCKRQDLSEAVKSMLSDIIRFQDRLYINQPIKAEMHRRYVVGLKQANNLLCVQKVKIIILASDIEKVPTPGGLDEIVTKIIDHANEQNVPIIFSFLRKQLGKFTYRKVPVSCIAILNYHGTEAAYQKMIEALEAAKKEYCEKFLAEKSRIMNELGIEDVKTEVVDHKNKTVNHEQDITYSLLKCLTEAISEISLKSSPNPDGIKEVL